MKMKGVGRGLVLDARYATAKTEKVKKMRYSCRFVVDVGNVEDATRAAELHHRSHAA